MPLNARLAVLAGVFATTVALLSGCGASGHGPTPAVPDVITVTRTVCGQGWRHPAAGLQTLQVRNTTTATLEITLIGATSGYVYAKLEGVGPGTTRAMPADVGSGAYSFECDGNNYGNRVGPKIRVLGHIRGGRGVAPVAPSQMITTTRQEEAYVAGGLDTLGRQTARLAAEIRSGDLGAARATWLAGHLTFERLGSAYGMFGDYDNEINGTPFGLPGGVRSADFAGFYRLEYGLWHAQPAAELTASADKLSTAARELKTAWPGMQLPPAFALSDLALRTHEVLENAMQFQLSGQDNFGSGTTLATLAASIDATREQLQILRPLLVSRYPDLTAVQGSLDRLQRLAAAAHTSHGWMPVTGLTSERRADLDAAAGRTVELLAGIPPLFEARPMP